MTGSHADSQPTGGRFDGIYGVLGGLEVIRTLNDHAHRNRASGRSRDLDQRGRLALRAGDGRVGRIRRRVHARLRSVAQGRGRQDDRRGTEAHRLRGRCAVRRPSTACRVRTAYRAGSDSRSRKQDDRRRHRRARPALVRDHADGPGSARGPDADAAPQGRVARRVARGRSRQPHRPRSCAARVRDGRHDAGPSELAQRDSGPRVLHRRLPSSRRRRARADGRRVARRRGARSRAASVWQPSSNRSSTTRPSRSTQPASSPCARLRSASAIRIATWCRARDTTRAICRKSRRRRWCSCRASTASATTKSRTRSQEWIEAGANVLLHAMLERACEPAS